jgi:hypothetical protein
VLMPISRSDAEAGSAGVSPQPSISSQALALEWLGDAERAIETLGSASPLGTVLVSLSAPKLGAEADLERGWGVTLGSVLLGYAARLADDRGAKPPHLPAIDSKLLFTASGDVDYAAFARDSARVGALSDCITELVGDVDAVAALTGGTRDSWESFAVVATSHLRHRFIRRGVRREGLPDADGFDLLLRLGYVVRCVDELAGEWPAGRADATYPGSASDGATATEAPDQMRTEDWLRQAIATTAGAFALEAEALLERGALGLLGEGIATQTPDAEDVSEAVGLARLGFALRDSEGRWTNVPLSASAETLVTEAEQIFESSASPESCLVELLCDVVRYGYCGGAEAAIDEIPGPLRAARSDVFVAAIDRYEDATAAAVSREVAGLLHLGYLLHRVIEVRADTLVASRITKDGDGCR